MAVPLSMFQLFFLLVLKKISWLAIQHLANGFQSGEADSADMPVFQLGKIDIRNPNLFRKLVERHLSVCHHSIKS